MTIGTIVATSPCASAIPEATSYVGGFGGLVGAPSRTQGQEELPERQGSIFTADDGGRSWRAAPNPLG